MDFQKEGVERWIGDEFVTWLNSHDATSFGFVERPDRAPDLLYRDGTTELLVEVAEIHYDAQSARLLWGPLRDDSGAPTEWGAGKTVDQLFVAALDRVLELKCKKAYPPSTILVLYHYSPFAPPSRMAKHVARATVPVLHPFRAIYFTATLPGQKTERGGYYCWRLVEAEA